MNIIIDTIKSEKKHKEKVALLTEKVKEDKNLVAQLVELLKTGTDVEKGTCAEIMKFVSKDKPELMEPYIDTLIEYINYKAPRVKWGAPETIGNLAQRYPQKVEKAIPNLLKNTKDKSTVVRWCAAFALTEIAKYNSEKQKELVSIFNDLVKIEQNNGVKNLYLKSLKVIEKQ
jgi:vesicle coat complex subunit